MKTDAHPRIRLLLLDDTDEVRSTMRDLLTEKGFEVLPYPDPSHCPLHQADQCHCTADEICADVLITDLDMPHMTGLEFIQEIRRKHCKVPHLAVLSGNADGLAQVQIEEPHCRIFAKPEGVPDLLKWLDQIQATLLPARALAARLP